MKTILMIIVLGTQGGMGNPIEPPRFYTQEFDSAAQCEVARQFVNSEDYRAWGEKISTECVTK